MMIKYKGRYNLEKEQSEVGIAGMGHTVVVFTIKKKIFNGEPNRHVRFCKIK